MRILATGMSGLLGSELTKYLHMITPTHEEMDITFPVVPMLCDMVLHAAAYTDLVGAEREKERCYAVNVLGTQNMVTAYEDVPFVQISTEYVRYPELNFYSLTKLEAEKEVSRCDNYLIIRTLFKPNPFPWDRAFNDQYTMGDYVDVIARMIAREVLHWDKKGKRIVYLGTGRKTMYDLAKQTRDVTPISVDDYKEVQLPKDYL